ncbi:VOC family protein [Paragemmobacter ruber]|uniref:VOC domain-containing protein n=1 Tax=Paragemmobacter ruber TaxID=1985673 RepID=A0ABW9Y0K9_9RHOB|nr:VOC family protein [Rhodobacter ruber]NBE06030.1 hypothetical protein [Rhodobacter ruber]
MTAEVRVIPELAVLDRPAAEAMLVQVFGFARGGDLLHFGGQAVALVQAEAAPGHGVMDHLALAVADVDAALAAFVARGARLEATTPKGPREIAEFWGAGVRYVFLEGPEGARIELCAHLGGAARPGLPGHDHLGIPCTDIAASSAFWEGLGAAPVAAVDLARPDGVTRVRFLSLGDSMVELYEPPALRGARAGFAAPALWRGLRLQGTALAPGLREGPDGLRVAVV